MDILPSIGPFSGLQKAADNVDEKQINRVEAIINLDDFARAQPSRSHQRQPPQTHRPRGLRTTVQEVKACASPVRADEEEDQTDGQAELRAKVGRNELPGT